MKVPFRSKCSKFVRWKLLGIERLRQALRHLQRLLTGGGPPEALALIPIRAVQPHVTRQRSRRTWRDSQRRCTPAAV